MEVNKISENYQPAWKGEGIDGVVRRIFTIIGKIVSTTYKRLIDKDGFYLNDNASNQLLIKRDYLNNENSE